MPRTRAFPFFGSRGFQPSLHLLPPLVLVSCLVASTAAPAAGGGGWYGDGVQDAPLLGQIWLGYGDAPAISFGPGGISLTNPATGDSVPPFQLSIRGGLASIDARSTAPGTVLLRSGSGSGQGTFRLSEPLSFFWPATESTPSAQLSWPTGTLFDHVVNGFSGGLVPFRIVASGTPPSASGGPLDVLTITAGPDADGFRFSAALFDGPGEEEAGDLPSGEEGPGTQAAPETSSVPGPLPLLGAGVAFRFSRRLRRRVKAAVTDPAPTL
jgi:hypothetical protein